MGAAALEEFEAEVEAGLCEAAIAVGTRTVGDTVEVDVTVTTVIAPLESVGDSLWVTTVGGGAVVTETVVDVDEDWEGPFPTVCGDPVVAEIDVKEQLAKSVAVGLTSVMILVTITGTDTVESPPVHVSI
jgi:hypothetical protein